MSKVSGLQERLSLRVMIMGGSEMSKCEGNTDERRRETKCLSLRIKSLRKDGRPETKINV